MTNQILDVALKALEELKASDILTLDVRDKTSITDYMLIASGGSSRQVRALAENVLEKVKQNGNQVLGSEGLESGDWALIDFGDLIVHVMQNETRQFYDLESLWHSSLNLREV